MADIKEMRNRSDRRDVVISHIIYVVLTFLYTLYLYFIFNLIYPDTVTAEYAMFNFGIIQLGIHHAFILASVVLQLLLYYYPKKILAIAIEICLAISAIWLVISTAGVIFETNIPNIFHRFLIIIPLLIGVVYLLRLIWRMHKFYFSYQKTESK